MIIFSQAFAFTFCYSQSSFLFTVSKVIQPQHYRLLGVCQQLFCYKTDIFLKSVELLIVLKILYTHWS